MYFLGALASPGQVPNSGRISTRLHRASPDHSGADRASTPSPLWRLPTHPEGYVSGGKPRHAVARIHDHILTSMAIQFSKSRRPVGKMPKRHRYPTLCSKVWHRTLEASLASGAQRRTPARRDSVGKPDCRTVSGPSSYSRGQCGSTPELKVFAEPASAQRSVAPPGPARPPKGPQKVARFSSASTGERKLFVPRHPFPANSVAKAAESNAEEFRVNHRVNEIFRVLHPGL